jgi:hypothetical protein
VVYYVPKKPMKKEVVADIRGIFNATNREEADRLLKINILLCCAGQKNI